MPSLVLELQREAMNPDARVSDVLRKALVVATKLEIENFREWVAAELRGYGRESQPPAYRRVKGQLKAHNPYQGWIPVVLQDTELAEKLSHRDIGQSIDELQALVENKATGGTLQVPLPHDWLMKIFAQTQEFQLGLVPTLLVDAAQIRGILEAVRNEVLKWSLELERQGILGEEMSFSAEEVQKADQTTYNIGSFTGVLGDVTGSTVQVGDYATIHSQLKSFGVPQPERNELENILEDLKTAPPEKRPSLAKRGIDWLARNGPAIGALSETIRGWFEA